MLGIHYCFGKDVSVFGDKSYLHRFEKFKALCHIGRGFGIEGVAATHTLGCAVFGDVGVVLPDTVFALVAENYFFGIEFLFRSSVDIFGGDFRVGVSVVAFKIVVVVVFFINCDIFNSNFFTGIRVGIFSVCGIELDGYFRAVFIVKFVGCSCGYGPDYRFAFKSKVRIGSVCAEPEIDGKTVGIFGCRSTALKGVGL